jgi:DNA-binding winged helix-turn-helix (wHTH) protein
LPRIARFGVFEADLESRELRKSGLKVRLSDQPFLVLATLFERPGDIVTREELRLRIWPADTFVDFDHSINAVVNKLREALGDLADSPRYIETIPRRGYRFVCPVEPTRTMVAPQVAEAVLGNAFAPVRDGIYFLRPGSREASPFVGFLEFSTGKVTNVGHVPLPPSYGFVRVARRKEPAFGNGRRCRE